MMNQGSRVSRVVVCVIVSIQCLALGRAARAAEPPGPPVQPQEAAKRVGLFQLKLTERSPLSKMSDVSARMGMPAVFDYTLAQEAFTAYVPKSPGPDGKYGLMVSLHFREYGWPAPAWTEVLEKYHIVWIGPQNCDDARGVIQRIGLVLDATFNAKKLWPIDDRRTYACVSSPAIPGSSFALQYADIFQGALHSIQWGWFEHLPMSKKKGFMWGGPVFKKPDPAVWEIARRRSRFFIADRSGEHPDGNDGNEDIANEGYLKSGFKYVKVISVPLEKMDHYAYYTADWFEEGVKFLDAPLSDPGFGKSDAAKPRPVPPSASSAAPQSAATRAAAPPVPAVDEKAVAAEKALSLAKTYLAAQNYAGARSRLEKLIQSYPDTRAAKEAGQMLKDIQGK